MVDDKGSDLWDLWGSRLKRELCSYDSYLM